MTKKEIINFLRHYNETHKADGFEIISLFGSYARGTEDLFSDIDLTYKIDHTVFHKDDAFAKLNAIAQIKNELERTLHKKVDLIPINTKNKYLQKSLDEEQIAI